MAPGLKWLEIELRVGLLTGTKVTKRRAVLGRRELQRAEAPGP